MTMRYLVGTFVDLTKIRTAIDQLAGMPYPVLSIPIPPREPTYFVGATGWMEHVLEAPFDVGDGQGLLRAPDDILPYCGQSAQVADETITVPPESALLTYDELSPALQSWLYAYEHPPDDW
jgi:hypothetical protein